jgi:hypothetical protein
MNALTVFRRIGSFLAYLYREYVSPVASVDGRKNSAAHEVGHALAAILLAPQHEIVKIRIPKGQFERSIIQTLHSVEYPREELFSEICFSYAGCVGEEMFCPEMYSFAHGFFDRKRIDSLFEKHGVPRFEQKALIFEATVKLRETFSLPENRRKFHIVMKFLCKKGEISGDELYALVN